MPTFPATAVTQAATQVVSPVWFGSQIDATTVNYTAAANYANYAQQAYTYANTTVVQFGSSWDATFGTTGGTSAAYYQYAQPIIQTGGYTVWDSWNGYQQTVNVAPLSAEEILRRERRQRQQKRQRLVATRRGRKLLLSLLDDEQKWEYAASGKITVPVADGRVFRLRKHKTAELLGIDGLADATYCIHLSGGYIPEDNLIAQMMLLRSDPAEFERIANVTRMSRPAPQSADDRAMLQAAMQNGRRIYSLAA